MDTHTTNSELDVLIIGAGAAGIAAGAALKKAGLRIRILEARDRIGGRVYTLFPTESEAPVDLGAEFVHGRPTLFKEVLEGVAPTPDQWWRRRRGKLVHADATFDNIESVYRFLSKEFTGKDLPFGELLKAAEGKFSVDAISETSTFVTGFYSAPLNEVSSERVLSAGASIGDAHSEDSFKPPRGYHSVLVPYLDDLQPLHETIELETIVDRIHWKRKEITVEAHDLLGNAKVFTAQRLVFTVPIGVWDKIVFDPPLADKERALTKMGMGIVHRVVLRFQTAFWQRRDFHPGYVQNPDTPFVTFWTGRPIHDSQITCWSGGSQCAKVQGNPIEQAIESLAATLEVSPARVHNELRESYYHDWNTDPFSLGSYAFVRPGGGEAAEILARPLVDTLFFAGEGLHPGERSGTVDGALETGIRAASEVLKKAALQQTA